MPKTKQAKKVASKKISTKVMTTKKSAPAKIKKLAVPQLTVAGQIASTFAKAKEQARIDYEKGLTLIAKQLMQAKSQLSKAKTAKASAQQKQAKAKAGSKGKTGKTIKALLDKAVMAVNQAETVVAQIAATYNELLVEHKLLKAANKKFQALNKVIHQFEKKENKSKVAAKKARKTKIEKPEKEAKIKKAKRSASARKSNMDNTVASPKTTINTPPATQEG